MKIKMKFHIKIQNSFLTKRFVNWLLSFPGSFPWWRSSIIIKDCLRFRFRHIRYLTFIRHSWTVINLQNQICRSLSERFWNFCNLFVLLWNFAALVMEEYCFVFCQKHIIKANFRGAGSHLCSTLITLCNQNKQLKNKENLKSWFKHLE